MANIGAFTKSGDRYTGAVRTLTLNVKAQIAPADKENDKAPDYRVYAGAIEIGAGWKKTSSTGRDYLSVKLDDPSLPAPIYASLVEAENDGEFTLIWSRRSGRVIKPPRSARKAGRSLSSGDVSRYNYRRRRAARSDAVTSHFKSSILGHRWATKKPTKIEGGAKVF